MALITQREAEFKKVLEDKGSFATVLLAVLIDEYSTDFFDWDPKALYMQIEEDMHAKVPDLNRDKIGALMLAMTTNQFFQNSDIFANVCRALSHSEADFSTFSPLTPEEMSWGVMEVIVNNPPDPERGNSEFSSEVSSFVGMLLTQQGVLQAPKNLMFAIYSSTNPVEDVETMFSDDESMFSAAMANQQSISREVDEHTRETFKLLKQQLDHLPITGRAKEEGAR